MRNKLRAPSSCLSIARTRLAVHWLQRLSHQEWFDDGLKMEVSKSVADGLGWILKLGRGPELGLHRRTMMLGGAMTLLGQPMMSRTQTTGRKRSLKKLKRCMLANGRVELRTRYRKLRSPMEGLFMS